jgi:hypothetical protein
VTLRAAAHKTQADALVPSAHAARRRLDATLVHRHFNSVRSSQAFALNIFGPLDADGAAGVMRGLGLDVARAELPEFEYLDPQDRLAETRKDSRHKTQVDVVLRGADGQGRALVALIEVKFTEDDFGHCSAYDSLRNPHPEVCRHEGLFGGDPSRCFQINNHGQGRRKYSDLLSTAPVTLPSLPQSQGGCLVRTSMNQPMRNIALGHAMLSTGEAHKFVFALSAPGNHQVVWRRFAALQAAFPDTETRAIIALPAEAVIEFHPDGGKAVHDHYPDPVLTRSGRHTAPIDSRRTDHGLVPLITDLDSLMAALDVADIDGLSSLVDEESEADAWIPPKEEQDLEPGHLTIRVANLGTALPYPFELAELWTAVDQLNDDAETTLSEDE